MTNLVAYLWFYNQVDNGQPIEGEYRQFYVSPDSCASTSSLEEEQPRAVFRVAIIIAGFIV